MPETEQHDVLVIGGGNAGISLAARLRPGMSVVVSIDTSVVPATPAASSPASSS